MKLINVLFIIVIIFLFPIKKINSQNINNTLGESGIFKIKDASTDYFTLTQSTGQVNILKGLRLEISENDSTIGVLYKGTNRFIHDYKPTTAEGNNIFIGINSGNFTMSASTSLFASQNSALGFNSLNSITTGYRNTAIGAFSLFSLTSTYGNTAIGFESLYSNSTAAGNTAIGYKTLYSSTTGESNTSIGSESMYNNTIGYSNVAIGMRSLYTNSTGGNNTAIGSSALRFSTSHGNTGVGSSALYTNTTGAGNSAFGQQSLYFNTTGNSNTAIGSYSLNENTTGNSNSALGYNSLASNTTGRFNTATGRSALSFNTTGYYNTAIGYSAGSDITTGLNNIAIGYDAQVPDGTSSNQIRIGNTSISYAGIQIAWTITSDRKWKENIETTSLGLDFISKLNPVSYTRNNDDKLRTEFGLIAQDVEETLNEFNINNTGMLTIDDNGNYELRYNDLLSPMIKAIQELKTEKDIEIARLKMENDDLKNKLEKFEEIQNLLIKEFANLKSNINENLKVSIGEK